MVWDFDSKARLPYLISLLHSYMKLLSKQINHKVIEQLLCGYFVLMNVIDMNAKGRLNMAAWLLNQNPRPCDQYPKKLNSQKAVNCRQLSNKQRMVS